MTVEGAPGLKATSIWPVFDCANACGRTGHQAVPVGRDSHIRHARRRPAVHHRGDLQDHQYGQYGHGRADCKEAYLLSWRLALKANALYRDGSKLSQPLNASLIADDEDEDDEADDAIDEIAPKAASRAVTPKR